MKKIPPLHEYYVRGVVKYPYFVCYGMEVGSPFSLRPSKAEVGGVYENAARSIYLCGTGSAFFINLVMPVQDNAFWEDMLPFKKLIAISELVLLAAPCLVKFSA